jgi:hypothetical protein
MGQRNPHGEDQARLIAAVKYWDDDGVIDSAFRCVMEIKSRPSLINAESNPISSFFIGFVGLLLLIAFYHWLFKQFFETTYLEWYFDNAAAIGIGSAVFSTVSTSLDENPAVISAHPMKFAGAYMRLVGIYFLAIRGNVRPTSTERSKAPDFDSIVGMVLVAVLGIVIVLGLLLIGPLQYFVFLFCGSPARFLMQSDKRVILNESGDELRELDNKQNLPSNWQDISIKKKPFTLTNVIVGLVAAVLKLGGQLGNSS